MRARGLGCAVLGCWLFGGLVAVLSGCGDPESPSIQNVLIYYEDPSDGAWKPLEVIEGRQVAQGSPILIEGKITDNTAVVSPSVAIKGERQDVEDVTFSCSLDYGDPSDEYYECAVTPSSPEEVPLLLAIQAGDLVRGDRISIQEVQESDGDEILQEVEIRVSEIDGDSETVPGPVPYRVLKIQTVVEGQGSLSGSLYKEAQDGVKERLRSGDFLIAGDPDAETLKLLIKAPAGGAFQSLVGTWKRKTLTKWDQTFALGLNPRSGEFSVVFQLFDPSFDGRPLEQAPTYRFTLSAYDAPDQKKDVGRRSERSFSLVFWPPRGEIVSDLAREDLYPPKIELDGIDETTEPITSETSARVLSGMVRDNAGEVQWLRVGLSNMAPQDSGARGYREKIYLFDPGRLSLGGTFSLTLHFVSDWDENGVIDVLEEGKGVPNFVQVTAQDVNGNEVAFPASLRLNFVPPSTSSSVPSIDLVETIPQLDENGQVSVPSGETLRIRAMSTDVSGQPLVEWWECPDCPEPPEGSWEELNEDLCICNLERRNPLNPGGEFPGNPWEWIDIPSESFSGGTVHVLKAIKKVRTAGNVPNALFSAREIRHLEDTTDPWLVAVLPVEVLGPIVSFREIPAPADGTILTEAHPVIPDGFLADFGTVAATILPRYSRLNHVVARVTGAEIEEEPERCKTPVYTGETGELNWDLGRISVQEGDRVCVGAGPLTGHAVVYVWQFEQVAEGLRVIFTTSSDLQACPQEPQDFPCPIGLE